MMTSWRRMKVCRLTEIRLRTQRHRVRIFFRFHATILEPNLYLPLGKAQRLRNLDTTATRQVAIAKELLFQFKCLFTAVGLTSALLFA